MQFLEISWDFGILYLVKFWDFSKDFLGFLMKCTKIFRVIYPSSWAICSLGYLEYYYMKLYLMRIVLQIYTK
jgi:hypothetical protein